MKLLRTTIGILALLGALAVSVRAENGMTPVGTLDRYPQEAIHAFGSAVLPPHPGSARRFVSGTLLPVPAARQLWQVFPLGEGVGPTGVLVRDAASLRVFGSFTVPGPLRRGANVAFGGEWMHAVDGNRRVFLVDQQDFVTEVDLATLATRPVGRLTPVGDSQVQGLLLAGLAFDARNGTLLALFGGIPAPPANRVTLLYRLDPATGAEDSRLVHTCDAGLAQVDHSSTYAAAMLVGPDRIHFACQRGVSLGAQHEPDTVVVGVPRDGGAETSISVDGGLETTLVDATAGRITVLDSHGLLTVVDVEDESVVGSATIASDGNTIAAFGAGIDESSGRVVFLSRLGLGHLDARSSTVPTPALAPSYADEGQERIVVDGTRAFVLPGFLAQRAERYTIYNIAA